MTTDASEYGLACTLSHEMSDGTLRPISFASKTLSSSQRKFSQIEKESFAVVFGVKKFHLFLIGRHFKIQSDHKPLEKLLGPNQPIPKLVSSRIQNWALILSAYDYEWEFKPSNAIPQADCLSKLPLKCHGENKQNRLISTDTVFHMEEYISLNSMNSFMELDSL